MFTRGATLRPRPAFDFAIDPVELPGGAHVVGFSTQSYNWIRSEGPVNAPEVSEMLVRLQTADGTPIKNQGYFNFIHESGQQCGVDRKIIPAAMAFALGNGLIARNRQIALNMYTQSASRDFFLCTKNELDGLGLSAASVKLEAMEYEGDLTLAQISAFQFAVEDLGFTLALDDLDPRIPHDQERIRVLGPYADVFKLRREVMRDHRNGIYPDLPQTLHNLRYAYPAWVVAEGVPRTHQQQLQGMPIDGTQSWWGELVPQA